MHRGHLGMRLYLHIFSELVNTGNDDGRTPLHLAIKYELNSRIKILLENGAGQCSVCA